MRVLHYSLGFPPYRSGGLTKFCMDLMIQQSAEGHDVALLWPGQIRLFAKGIRIKDHGIELVEGRKIRNYEIINPLPVSYDEGINQFDSFTIYGDRKAYSYILDAFNPDCIHIHTLMGLHEAFLEEAKERRIRLVFTAHDYFPICPKVTMFREGRVCDKVGDCSECSRCNETALGLWKIRILQSPLYRYTKNNSVIRRIRKKHRDSYLGESRNVTNATSTGLGKDYIELRKHYYSMLRLMDIVHYNSRLTKTIYEKYLGDFPNVLIGITHGNIADNRIKKTFSDDMLRIRYLGTYSEAKGFFYMKRALDKLWEYKKNFSLDVHFELSEDVPYIKTNGRYTYSELEEIFDNTDVLLAPSIWYETFGFTVLEALSYGVPVIITDNVGASDILADGAGIIVNSSDSNELYEALRALDSRKLVGMNRNIVEHQNILTLSEMAKIIEKKCYLQDNC